MGQTLPFPSFPVSLGDPTYSDHWIFQFQSWPNPQENKYISLLDSWLLHQNKSWCHRRVGSSPCRQHCMLWAQTIPGMTCHPGVQVHNGAWQPCTHTLVFLIAVCLCFYFPSGSLPFIFTSACPFTLTLKKKKQSKHFFCRSESFCCSSFCCS